MKNLSLPLGRFAVVVLSALSLGACNRAEYAGVSRSSAAASSTSVAAQSAPASQTLPYIATDESAVVVAPAAPSVAPVAVAPSPAPQALAVAPMATAPVAVAPVAKAEAAPKASLVQRLALRKITKQLTKLAQAPQFKKRDATASTTRLDSNLRSGLLFLVLGLLVSLFAGVSGIFGVIGAILAVIGVVFIVLWLLDQA